LVNEKTNIFTGLNYYYNFNIIVSGAKTFILIYIIIYIVIKGLGFIVGIKPFAKSPPFLSPIFLYKTRSLRVANLYKLLNRISFIIYGVNRDIIDIWDDLGDSRDNLRDGWNDLRDG